MAQEVISEVAVIKKVEVSPEEALIAVVMAVKPLQREAAVRVLRSAMVYIGYEADDL